MNTMVVKPRAAYAVDLIPEYYDEIEQSWLAAGGDLTFEEWMNREQNGVWEPVAYSIVPGWWIAKSVSRRGHFETGPFKSKPEAQAYCDAENA